MSLADQVVKKLVELECPIVDTHFTKGRYIICSDVVIITCLDKTLTVLFHVAIKPDHSASLILELNKIKGVKNILVEDLFVYINSMDNVIIGNDAIKAYDYTLKKDIINKFMEEQRQITLLMRMKEEDHHVC